MDLSFTQEDEAFRAEVRAFLQDKLPARLSDKVRKGQRLTKADMEEWHAILNARGWLANHWPVEWGGTGWSVMQRFIFETEVALAHAPRIVPFGLSMLAPVLIKYGSEAQKKHWLPRILDGTDWWCQGYSEPGAGSDLAALKTSAVREGDHYVVNGQKTWTTLGQYADMIFCLVRTDPEAQQQRGRIARRKAHQHEGDGQHQEDDDDHADQAAKKIATHGAISLAGGVRGPGFPGRAGRDRKDRDPFRPYSAVLAFQKAGQGEGLTPDRFFALPCSALKLPTLIRPTSS